MLCLLSIQHSFFTRTLLHMSMCRATEEGKNLPRSAERDILPSAQIWPSDWWPRVASSLSQWPHTQGVLVIGRSVDCENAENRMEDKESEHSLLADIYFDCNPANVFVCLSKGGWKPGPWAWTDYLYGQQLQRSKTLAAFVYSLWHPRDLRK